MSVDLLLSVAMLVCIGVVGFCAWDVRRTAATMRRYNGGIREDLRRRGSDAS